MPSRAKIYGFIGPPCSGKTDVSTLIFDRLIEQKFRVFYFDKKPKEFKKYYQFVDRCYEVILYGTVFLYSLLFIRKMLQVKIKRNVSWIRRFSKQFANSMICRRFLLSIAIKYDYILVDHCLESMYIFEIADPRNVIGLRLWKVMMAFTRFFPTVETDGSFFLYAEPPVLMDRLRFKDKEVRKGLSEKEKESFFESTSNLIEVIRSNLSMPLFSADYMFIDSSEISSADIADRIFKKIR